MKIRDRIKEFRRVIASDLRPNPKNWRTHPDRQKDVLKGVLGEIGYADALLVRELPDGSLELIDGHLRAETTPDQEVPVLVLDLNDEEADKLLAVLDPLASLAEKDDALLASLAGSIETDNAALQSLLAELIRADETPAGGQSGNGPLNDLDIPKCYQIVVECADEREQQTFFEMLVANGATCKILNL
ncbi:MAG: ParB N-terminal domain-containing protein [Planctomycetaceae bacterium]|nr:ParB N-terminal domain-containing protein [Planctomycetaceae bacterium]